MKNKHTIKKEIEEQLEIKPWKCISCSKVAEEGKEYCYSCGSYWEDVRNGLFDQDWT